MVERFALAMSILIDTVSLLVWPHSLKVLESRGFPMFTPSKLAARDFQRP
jgi:hypothetical protein